MIQEIIPCIMCIIIARLWCLLLFVPALLEQNFLHTHTIGMCFIFCIMVALGSAQYAQRTRLSVQVITMLVGCSTICYGINKIAIFDPTLVLKPDLVPIVVILCSSVTCFVVVYLTAHMLWKLANHIWRIISLIVGLIIGCVDLSYWIDTMYYNLEHVYILQGVIWIFILTMAVVEKVLHHIMRRKEKR